MQAALAGKSATVEAVEEDFEGRVAYCAVAADVGERGDAGGLEIGGLVVEAARRQARGPFIDGAQN